MTQALSSKDRYFIIFAITSALVFLVLVITKLYALNVDNANNPYTYEWGEATEMYISRDGQVVVPRTIIDYRKNNGHYYGLRIAIDHLNCNPGGASRFSNRRRYFILPIAEDAAIEFKDRGKFEAELKRRISSGADKLDYSIFQEKWDYYSEIYAKSSRTDCEVTEGP